MTIAMDPSIDLAMDLAMDPVMDPTLMDPALMDPALMDPTIDPAMDLAMDPVIDPALMDPAIDPATTLSFPESKIIGEITATDGCLSWTGEIWLFCFLKYLNFVMINTTSPRRSTVLSNHWNLDR